MGTLPKDRILATRALEHAGLGYFGPLRVMVGRREEKRYGVLFSCNYTSDGNRFQFPKSIIGNKSNSILELESVSWCADCGI